MPFVIIFCQNNKLGALADKLQFSQDHFVDPINLVSDSSVDSPPTIKKRRVKPLPEMQRDVTINVTNEFLASPSR